MSLIKRWNGSRWVDHLPQRWNGSKWVDSVVKRWNGRSWEVISEKEYVETWGAKWTSSYYGSSNSNVRTRVAKWGDTVSHYSQWYGATWNQIVSWNGLRSPHIISEGVRYIIQKTSFPNRSNTGGWMYHGRESVADKFSSDYGRQRSMIGFNHDSIRSYTKGAKIVKVELYLRSRHWHYTSGGNATIGTHNSGSATPSSFSETKHNVKTEKFSKRNEGKWITLPNSVGEALRDNKAKGLTLYGNTNSLSSYGYFYGKGKGSEPKIRITYKK